jgi:nudix-type nucleoside diphosphatase (YffH/AdpP family)
MPMLVGLHADGGAVSQFAFGGVRRWAGLVCRRRSDTGYPKSPSLLLLSQSRCRNCRWRLGGIMRQFRNVEIRKQTRLLDDKFKVDELVVAHEKIDGSMSRDQRQLIFERGDSAAVLIFNVDKKCVVLVDQFKAPTLGKGSGGGWITETVAGIIERYETPEGTAMREAMEETGYKIRDLTLISKFFSSPGGTSECVHLLVNRVVPDADLIDATMLLARKLARGPRIALGLMKQNFNAAESGTLAELLDLEARRQIETGRTKDHREAARAFVEKRVPVFTGQ